MVKAEQPQSALEDIRAHGDPIDARHNGIRPSEYVAFAAMGVPLGIHAPPGPFEASAYGLYIPAAFAAVVTGQKVWDRHTRARNNRLQQEVRDYLGEPVDVVRTRAGGFRNDAVLTLRWYGLDTVLGGEADEPANPVQGGSIQRARRIINFAEQHSIDFVSMAASPFESQIAEQEDGSVLDAKRFMSQSKATRAKEYTDNEVNGQVLMLTPDEWTSLLDQAEVLDEKALIRSLIAKVGDPHLAKLYGHLEATQGSNIRSQMKTVVKKLIERHSDAAEAQPVKQENGDFIRQKTYINAVVDPKGRAMKFAHTHNMNGQLEVNFAGAGSIATLAGHPDDQSLLDKLKMVPVDSLNRGEVLVGLALLLRDNDDQTAQGVSALGESAETVQPFFARLAEKDDSIDIRRRSKLGSACVAAVTSVAAMAAGIGVGLTLVGADNAATNHTDARFAEYVSDNYKKAARHSIRRDQIVNGESVPTEEFEDYLKTETDIDMVIRKIEAGVDEIYSADYAASTLVSEFLLSKFNIETSPYVGIFKENNEFDEWLRERSLDIPQNPYVQENQMGVGDVASTENKVIFTVDSLRGAPTDGYWFSDTYNHIQIKKDDDLPFLDRSLSFQSDAGWDSKRVTMDQSLEEIQAAQPDFMVETPYLGLETNGADIGRQPLPMPQNARLLGAMIVDLSNPDVSFPFQATKSSKGLYYHEIHNSKDLHQLYEADIEKPALRYWVKLRPDAPLKIKADLSGTTLTAPNGGYLASNEGGYLRDIKDLGEGIRRTLGLPEDASAKEVIAAIKYGKQYSYEPFEYDGVKEVELKGLNNQELIREVGKVLTALSTANCNVATMTAILATLESSNYNAVSGYRDNGDGLLTQQESHAWMIDRKGTVIDPTPVELAPGVERRTEIDEGGPDDSSLQASALAERGAAALLAGTLGYIAWRRRRQLATVSDKLRVNMVLSRPSMQQTIAQLKHDLYSPKTATYVVPMVPTKPVVIAAQEYVRNVPAKTHETAVATPKREKLRRKILQLNDAAIRRHVARSS